jgi:hypothetical protein
VDDEVGDTDCGVRLGDLGEGGGALPAGIEP